MGVLAKKLLYGIPRWKNASLTVAWSLQLGTLKDLRIHALAKKGTAGILPKKPVKIYATKKIKYKGLMGKSMNVLVFQSSNGIQLFHNVQSCAT